MTRNYRVSSVLSMQTWELREKVISKKKIKERVKEKDKDGRGVKCGAPLLPQTHKKSTCRMIHMEHLLNAGRRP